MMNPTIAISLMYPKGKDHWTPRLLRLIAAYKGCASSAVKVAESEYGGSIWAFTDEAGAWSRLASRNEKGYRMMLRIQRNINRECARILDKHKTQNHAAQA